MAIAEMKKIHMAVHKSISDELVNKLQKLGCCQFIPQSHDQVEERDIAPLRSRLRHTEELLGEARFVTRFLDPYATEKGGGMAMAFGDAPVYSLEELAKLASEDAFREMSARVREMEKRLSDAKSGASRVVGLRAQLTPLAELPYSLDFYSRGTEFVTGVILSAPRHAADDLKKSIEDTFADMADIHALPSGEKDAQQLLSVIYPKERAEEFQGAIASFQTVRIDVPPHFSGTAADELAALGEEAEAYAAAEAEVTEEIIGIANETYRTCQHCTDYWSIQKARLDALIEGEQTEQILLFSFWIPTDCVPAFNRTMEPYQSLAELVVESPGEDEQPPTVLKNASWSNAIEALTTMYGTPTYGKLDPTSIITPFFYLFFGMCFGDAGYGLVISSLLIAIMMKKTVTGTLRKFMLILITGNLVALVYGALTFSWFGDAIAAFPFLSPLAGLQKLQVLDPMNDPMTLLGISLALGFFQIMVGLVIAMRENLKAGDKMAAYADQGGWMLFLCGLVLTGLSASGSIGIPTKLSGFVAIAGAIVLIATQGRSKERLAGKIFSGVMSLYNITGYLGDILSYSRLLALGLGSAAVGMVINLLCNLVSGTPGVGIPLAILIFVVGHLFSVAVNMLGAFVHALRLQYVEFFSKFYEASGEEFTPLAMSPQFVKLTEQAEKA